MRQDVVHNLARALQGVVSRRVGVALGVWGEPGIGKTWTAQQILRDLSCSGLSLHATVPDSALLGALPRPRKLPAWADAQLERLKNGEYLEPKTVLNTLTAVLRGLAPFVLHLEDLHECNPERRNLIVGLAQAVQHARGVGLLVTGRQEPPKPFRNHRLEPLVAAETRAMLEGELGAELPPEALKWLEGRTGGNPLFALEFEKYLARQGFLWSDGKRWHWRVPPKGFLPVTVEALVGQLIHNPSFKPETLRALESLTLLPEQLPPEARANLWAQMADLDSNALERANTVLEGAGLLIEGRFAHPLFGEVLLAGWGAGRQNYARRALEALTGNWPEQAAPFLEAHPLSPEKSLELLERAAAQAGARGDTGARADFLARAVRWYPPETRNRRALEVARLLRDAGLPGTLELAEQAAASGYPEALFLWAELLVEAGRFEEAMLRMVGFPEDPPAAHTKVRKVWELSLNIAGARGLFTEALERWAEHPEWQDTLSFTTYRMVGAAHAYTGRLEQAELMAQTLLNRRDLGPEALQQARNLLGQVLQARADWPRLFEVERETIALARTLQTPKYLALALLNHAHSLSSHAPEGCSVAEVQAHLRLLLDEAGQLFGRLGMTLHYSVCLLRRAGIQMEQGLFQEAETLLLEGHTLLEQSSPPHWKTESHLKQSRLYLDWQPPYGPPLALKHAQAALELVRTTGDQKLLSAALEYSTRAEAGGGDPKRALAFAQEALERAEEQSNPNQTAQAHFAYAVALEANGALKEACAALRAASEQHRVLGNLKDAQRMALELDRIKGDLEGARTRWIWFQEVGHLALALRAVRYFPALEAPILEKTLSQPTNQNSQHSQPLARLKVLGPIQLEREGQSVHYRGHKRTELLAYLLERRIAGHQGADSLELLDTLYPDVSEDEGKRTLKQQIYLIRGDLGRSSILSTPGGYALSAVSSDAEEFLAGGESALWRGTYLEGLGDGWIGGVKDALFLALKAQLESPLERQKAPCLSLARSLCGMEPYDLNALKVALRALLEGAGTPAAHTFYLERRTLLVEVGEELPVSFEEFLEFIPLQP